MKESPRILTPKQLAVGAFIPFAFCFFLVVAQSVLAIWLPGFGGSGFSMALWFFLPMCFYYAGMLMADNRRMVQLLQERVETLEGAIERGDTKP